MVLTWLVDGFICWLFASSSFFVIFCWLIRLSSLILDQYMIKVCIFKWRSSLLCLMSLCFCIRRYPWWFRGCISDLLVGCHRLCVELVEMKKVSSSSSFVVCVCVNVCLCLFAASQFTCSPKGVEWIKHTQKREKITEIKIGIWLERSWMGNTSSNEVWRGEYFFLDRTLKGKRRKN